jgi:MtN3 and saliva related transmembrane protein
MAAGLLLKGVGGDGTGGWNPVTVVAFGWLPTQGPPMALLDWTGYLAAFCTTAAFVPQVLRVWRTRSTRDISLRMFLVLVTGLCLWLVYGFWRGEAPIIAANGATLLLAGTILFFKLRYRDQATVTD